MSTLSVPLGVEHEKFIKSMMSRGYASSKAAVIRRALEKLEEDEAVERILRTEREPNLKGDLKELLKKIK